MAYNWLTKSTIKNVMKSCVNINKLNMSATESITGTHFNFKYKFKKIIDTLFV